ncbi:MAG TPA: glutamate--tRNA ligase [Candidatus Krumholzibacteria bacterium]|nr:glutamate--tRNA ligase [Candidatus Krumholzibacteria bacterium]
MPGRPQPAKTAPVRVRFAPSPTGHLHVGGARTALFNWLFARKHGGTFILRIEDTDAQRSSDESIRGILEAMQWLGLDWDEGPGVGGDFGPYQQTSRNVLYRAEAERLQREGHAYRCFCTHEELAAMRAEAASRGAAQRYDGRCRGLEAQESERRATAGVPSVVRLALPPSGQARWLDLTRGELAFDLAELDDLVLLKSDGQPTYNFAVVVDDAKMRISHVIRGDDHISNTPKQLMIFDALGFARPEFAHLPMIIGADKTRLSKRHGATSVTAFRDEGILAPAMVNYLALLGWSAGDDREVMRAQELVSYFGLDKVSRNPAVFDVTKLQWMNHEHFARLDFGDKIRALLPCMRRHGLWPPSFRAELVPAPHLRVVSGSPAEKVAASIQPVSEEEWRREEPTLVDELPRLRLILDTLGNRFGGPHDVGLLTCFYSDAFAYDPDSVAKHLHGDAVPERLQALATELEAVKPFIPEAIETALRGLAARLGIKAGDLIHPARVALTGQAVSPGIFEVFHLLGRAKAVERLRRGAAIAIHDRALPPGPSPTGSETARPGDRT